MDILYAESVSFGCVGRNRYANLCRGGGGLSVCVWGGAVWIYYMRKVFRLGV